WTWLILLLVSTCAAFADPVADAEKPLSNVETGRPPPDAGSRLTTEKPAGSDPETTPLPLRGAVPAVSESGGESTGRNTTVEPSEQTGALTPALVLDRAPTGKTDQAVTDAAAAGMQTPTPPATPNANQPVLNSSPAAATPDSEQPVVESAPAVAPTSAAAASSNPGQPVEEPSSAVVAAPVPTPTSNSEQPVGKPSPAVA